MTYLAGVAEYAASAFAIRAFYFLHVPDERLELSMFLGKGFTDPLEHPFLSGGSVLDMLTLIISEKHQLPPFVTLGIFT